MTINWADDGTVKAFQWLQDIVKKNWTPPDQAIKAERQLMSTDQMVFKLDGPYLTGILQSDNPSVYKSVADVNTHWGVTTTPVGPGQSSPVTCADIHNLGMSSSSNNKDLSWKLIDYLTSNKQVLTNYLITEGVFPHKSQVTKGGPYAYLFADEISQSFINNVFPTMRPPAYHPKYSQAATYVVTTLQEIAGGANVSKSLAQLNTDVKTVFGQ
jgi:multiple sugar transport system substrate-binding protein